MQRFQFPLQRALELRESQLKVEQAHLARLNSEKSQLLSLAGNLAKELDGVARLTEHLAAPITGVELISVAAYRQTLARRIARVKKQAAEYDTRIAAQLRRVVEADRNKQLLEQFKQEKLDEWKYNLNRELENTAGDLYLARRAERSR